MLSTEDKKELIDIIKHYCGWYDQEIADLKRQIDSLKNDVPTQPPAVVIPKNTWIDTAEQLPIKGKQYPVYYSRFLENWTMASWDSKKQSFSNCFTGVDCSMPDYWMDIELPKE